MNAEKRRQTLTHIAVSTIGGFFGAYAIVNFCELFANAQTSNMIHLVSSIVSGSFEKLPFIFASLFSYMAGNAFCVLYKKFSSRDMRTVSLLIDFLTVLGVSVIVRFTDSSFVLLPILFAMPVQWNAFAGDAGYNSSTIFSTNNLRQATMSLVSYILTKDRGQLEKTRFYWLTILGFHLGVALACFSSIGFGFDGMVLGFVPVALGSAAYALQKNAVRRIGRRLRTFVLRPRTLL